jgi:uncharacterized damage-inducible protein DinB
VPARLITFFEGWSRHNELLCRAIAPLDSEQLSLSAAQGLWSVRMIANHVVSVRAWWFNEWMGEGGDELARFTGYDEGGESAHREAPAIVDALQKSWASLSASLGRWTEDDLSQEFQRPERNANRGRPWRTRRYIVWHVAEHDLHHGGEISLTLGMHGLEGLDI